MTPECHPLLLTLLLALHQKYAPNFTVVVSVLLPICYQICSGMPYLCVFVKEAARLLGSMADNLE